MSEDAINFRVAEADDLPAIVALLADDDIGATREDQRTPLATAYTDAFQSIVHDKNQLLAVAVNSNKNIIGTLQISFIPGISRLGAWRGQIEAVRISTKHRQSGLGRKMFDWAITQCQLRGCKLVQLTSDKSRPDAHRFYKSLGFVDSHIGYKLNL